MVERGVRVARLTYIVEIDTTSPDVERLERKLKREMELMYGNNVRVFKYKEMEQIRWVNGE